ncbi:MAG: hypothetical protein BWY78_00078 [Alphaproteobacteria bacterium ADurb.Bin438]|nr:MAG: hypothetical protein BWY78_00078 [Alphaproteobacteria bacterium ADurb.Bin438]
MTAILYRRKNGSIVIEFNPPIKPGKEIDPLTQSAIDRFFNEAIIKPVKKTTEKEELTKKQ